MEKPELQGAADFVIIAKKITQRGQTANLA